MPELPEVETTRRCVEPDLAGRTITSVDVARDRMLRRQPNPADFRRRLENREITRLRRHGKFLLFDVADDFVWVTHLGMSGRVAMTPQDAPLDAHTNVRVAVDTGVEFRLVDPRTFGFVAAYTPAELAESPIGLLGPDALTALPRAPALHATLAGRSAPIKALLLDQRLLAGVGNIYADESLHRSAISPHRSGQSLTGEEAKALRQAIKVTLAAGLRDGGTSLDDLAYLLPDGRAGQYVSRLRAYGRQGEPCRRCGDSIRRDIVRQRSTFWCPGCQT